MARPRNIILIVADSLRYDSVYRRANNKFKYPARLKYTRRNAIQFSQARSSGCWTLPATASMFTGMMPHEHRATGQSRKLRADVPILPELLRQAGYRTYQVTANVATTGIFDLDRGFDQIFKIWNHIEPIFSNVYKFVLMLGKPRIRKLLFSKDQVAYQLTQDMKIAQCWVQNTYQTIFDKTRELLHTNQEQGHGSFLFLNLMESHFPYHVDRTFQLSGNDLREQINEMSGLYHMLNQSFLKSDREYINPKTLRILKHRQYRSWKLISRDLDDFLHELHEDKDNLVIFCSDHGDNFGEHGWVYHFSNVTDAGNQVPVFWFGHDHPAPDMLDHPVSMRFIYNSILEACGLPHSGGTLFKEEAFTLPIMQSYWYNNQGKTLDKYKYNQFCFVENEKRFLQREDDWYAAAVQRKTKEPRFKQLKKNLDPIEHLVEDAERRQYLAESLNGFLKFSESLSS